MRLVIVDVGIGNVRSVARSFGEAIGASGEVRLSSCPGDIRTADRVVFPGDGAFGACADGLSGIPGLTDALREHVEHRERPFLGICVGMQLLMSASEETPGIPGLSWIQGDVREIPANPPEICVPHMGWNTLKKHRDHPLLRDLVFGENGLHAYFLHRFYCCPDDARHSIASTQHGVELTAIVAREAIVGTQFHPEKSQSLGMQFVSNFLSWRP